MCCSREEFVLHRVAELGRDVWKGAGQAASHPCSAGHALRLQAEGKMWGALVRAGLLGVPLFIFTLGIRAFSQLP